MSTQVQARRTQSRHRSTSDPFLDPPPSSHRPPPLPPTRPRERAPMPHPGDVVTVKPTEPRTRMGRSATSSIVPSPTTTLPPRANRSMSQDSVILAAQLAEKNRLAKEKLLAEKEKKKDGQYRKGSSHADIIDRLDYSGVGISTFHHDGPFDACAPSRNRHRNKAPMLSWATSPRSEAAPNSPDTLYEKDPQYFDLYGGQNDSPYPSPGFSSASPVADSDHAGNGRLAGSMPKKRYDALAEAWGIAEPEPFEEFFAGGGSGHASAASSIYNGREGHRIDSNPHTTRRARDGRDGRDIRDVYREYLDDGRPAGPSIPTRRNTNRGVPPPKPISLPGANAASSYPPTASTLESSPPSTPTSQAPKRSRSLMHRIRKMRETPNVPVSAHDEIDDENPSPTSSTENHPAGSPLAARPTHRSSNSFLGRFGRPAGAGANSTVSPILDASEKTSSNDPKQKTLPSLPPSDAGHGAPMSPNENSSSEGYFENGGGANLGRKTSLLKKVYRGAKRSAK
ncbi:hypothetical protein SISSUDRAFT_1062875 [Sistotremastrum suecicum HHB10207 ss-3]|uniref:Pal1-domain-containing protein n=1 Tax=Sistotremastrum suecicum HHB10207 ss-3 TaxID=1314776 RepID=A0A166CG32_9AGAM|nr:hypothetical protein SISSUDRAFT_1062875 [Sistotremastrum suecicum HHB10207 ss-3]